MNTPEYWLIYTLNHEMIHEVLNEIEGEHTGKAFDNIFIKKALKDVVLINKYMWEDGTPKFN